MIQNLWVRDEENMGRGRAIYIWLDKKVKWCLKSLVHNPSLKDIPVQWCCDLASGMTSQIF